MFDKIVLPKASSVYDDRKYSNDLTSKEFHKHKKLQTRRHLMNN